MELKRKKKVSRGFVYYVFAKNGDDEKENRQKKKVRKNNQLNDQIMRKFLVE